MSWTRPVPDQPDKTSREAGEPGCTPVFGNIEHKPDPTRPDAGPTVRKLIDCLIPAVTLRSGIQILHEDCDFDIIARHSPLEVVTTTQG